MVLRNFVKAAFTFRYPISTYFYVGEYGTRNGAPIAHAPALISRVEQMFKPVYTTSKVCPVIAPLALDEVQTLLKEGDLNKVGDTVVLARASMSEHFYLYAACVADIDDWVQTTGRARSQLLGMFRHRYFWPALWTLLMPQGGAITEPSLTLGGQAETNLETVSAKLTSAQDPVELTSFTQLEDAQIGLASSFLAQTLAGHALLGSVLHGLYVSDGKVYLVWVGAGTGTPVIAGPVNNAAALQETVGIWPQFVANFQKLTPQNIATICDLANGTAVPQADFDALLQTTSSEPSLIGNILLKMGIVPRTLSWLVDQPGRVKGSAE